MLDATKMTDPALHQGDGRQGPDHDPDRHQSPRGDSASNLSRSSDQRDQGQGAGDLQDVIHNRDVGDRIEN
jgi:hypothetical protein